MILIKNPNKIPPLERGDTIFWWCSNKKMLSVIIDKNKESFKLYSITNNRYLKYPNFCLKRMIKIITNLHIIKADGTVFKYVG